MYLSMDGFSLLGRVAFDLARILICQRNTKASAKLNITFVTNYTYVTVTLKRFENSPGIEIFYLSLNPERHVHITSQNLGILPRSQVHLLRGNRLVFCVLLTQFRNPENESVRGRRHLQPDPRESLENPIPVILHCTHL